MEMSGALTTVCHGSVGKIPRVCFMYAKKAVNEKIAGRRRKQLDLPTKLSPQAGAFSGDSLDQKSKTRLFPGRVWAVVTNC